MSSNKSWYSIQSRAETPRHADISIHDEIGFWGIRFQDFARDLKALGELDTITVSLNSPGGDVFDGIAIHNFLASQKAHITVRVEGIAASIASVIAMAGDDIQIPENAFMMIHNPWGVVIGDSEEMRDMAETMDKIRGSLVASYRKKTGMEDSEIISMLDAETWMTGAEAVEKGFADTLLDGVALAASIRGFDTRRFAKMPTLSAEIESTSTEQVESEKTPSLQEEAAKVESTETPAATTETTPAETAVTAPPQAGLLQRIKAAFNGDPAIRAELEQATARVTDLTSQLQARDATITDLTAQLAEFNALKAQVTELEAKSKSTGQAAAAIVAQHGFDPNKGDPLPSPAAASEPSDIVAEYNAIEDPKLRSEFFQANKDKLIAARFKRAA